MATQPRKARPTRFAIQDADLETTPPIEAFVLGIEWGMIWQRAQLPAAAHVWVHASNASRVARLLQVMRRDFVTGDSLAGMIQLSISGLD
jgi:hypothetical protein